MINREEVIEKGQFLGEGQLVKGGKYKGFKYKDRVFVGVFDESEDYLCAWEEITELNLDVYVKPL